MRILSPMVDRLSSLRASIGDVAKAAALQKLQDWVLEMQAPHLGPGFTDRALEAAGAVPASNEFWMAEARQSVLCRAWWSAPHAAVSSQGVVAWLSAHLEDRNTGAILAEDPGTVYFADDSNEQSIIVERMLQPIFLQVTRNGHAERRALVSLLRSLLKSLGQSRTTTAVEGLQATQGWVRLYASHYLCISCLAVLAQFTRLVPNVIVQVGYDNAWSSWFERPIPEAADGLTVLCMGRAG